MHVTWRARLEQHPRLRDVSAWPSSPDPTQLPKARRKYFLRNLRVVTRVMAGEALVSVAKDEGLSSGRVTQLMNRCLGGPTETEPALSKGLVPNNVISGSEPDAPARGRFAQLLQEVSGLRSGMDQMLLDRLKDQPWAEVPSTAAYFNLFKNLLARAGWPLDAYPYTTASLAYESVRRDLHWRWAYLCQALKARKRAFTGSPLFLGDQWLYDRIEIDEQLIDCEQSTVGLELEFGERLPALRLPRLTLLSAIDKATDCILGFQLALTQHPQQDDFLALLHQCVSRFPERKISTPGLELPAGAGFPGSDSSLPLPLPREIALDNAWIHHAYSVESFITTELGATVSYGRPQSPTVRNAIETSFKRLNQHLSHRVASTTGSHVTDPKRESAQNRKGVPLMPLSFFEDALYITLAENNNRPRPHLGSATPLEALRHQSEQAYIVDVDDDRRSVWNPFLATREVTVHDLSTPKRKPFINFEYLRYKGPGLLSITGSRPSVWVRYDRRDIRALEALNSDGQSLGTLHCPSTWKSHSHGISTRKYLFKHQRQLIRKSLDPLTEYLRQQSERLSNPKDVAKFLTTYQEFIGGFGLPTSLWQKPKANPREEEAKQPAQKRSSANPTLTKAARRYWSPELNPGINR